MLELKQGWIGGEDCVGNGFELANERLTDMMLNIHDRISRLDDSLAMKRCEPLLELVVVNVALLNESLQGEMFLLANEQSVEKVRVEALKDEQQLGNFEPWNLEGAQHRKHRKPRYRRCPFSGQEPVPERNHLHMLL